MSSESGADYLRNQTDFLNSQNDKLWAAVDSLQKYVTTLHDHMVQSGIDVPPYAGKGRTGIRTGRALRLGSMEDEALPPSSSDRYREENRVGIRKGGPLPLGSPVQSYEQRNRVGIRKGEPLPLGSMDDKSVTGYPLRSVTTTEPNALYHRDYPEAGTARQHRAGSFGLEGQSPPRNSAHFDREYPPY
jgi:hypothetical protein